jgi:hypothetical protein
MIVIYCMWIWYLSLLYYGVGDWILTQILELKHVYIFRTIPAKSIWKRIHTEFCSGFVLYQNYSEKINSSQMMAMLVWS